MMFLKVVIVTFSASTARAAAACAAPETATDWVANDKYIGCLRDAKCEDMSGDFLFTSLLGFSMSGTDCSRAVSMLDLKTCNVDMVEAFEGNDKIKDMATKLASLKKALEGKKLTLTDFCCKSCEATAAEASGGGDQEISDKLTALFESKDVDKDGKLNIAEMKEVFLFFGTKVSEDQLKSGMTFADKDKDGKLNVQELDMLIKAMKTDIESTGMGDTAADMSAAIAKVDKNKDKKLNLDELGKFVESQGKWVNDATLKQVLAAADKDKDGMIDMENDEEKTIMIQQLGKVGMAVSMELTMKGLDYEKLAADKTVKDGLVKDLTTLVLDNLPNGYKEEHVSIALSAGSVKVTVQITPLPNVDAEELAAAVTEKKAGINEKALLVVKNLPSLSKFLGDGKTVADLTVESSAPKQVAARQPGGSSQAPIVKTSGAVHNSALCVLILAAIAFM